MPTYLEQLFANGFSDVFGLEEISAVVLMAFFTLILLWGGTRLDGKVVVLVPVLLLAAFIVPWLVYLLALGGGFLIYLAITRFTNR